MNLKEMQTALERYGFNAEDPLTMWINAAMHDFENDFDWPWLESNAETIKVAAGVATLVLPAEALKIITVRDSTNLRKLKYYDRRRFLRDTEEPAERGLPLIYTILNTNEIQLWRVPEAEYSFEVVYQGLTKDLAAAGDIPTTLGNVWPVNAHFPIVMKAAALALQAENEEERAKNALDQYDKAVEKLRKKFGERELDEPDTVQDVQGYGEDMRTGIM